MKRILFCLLAFLPTAAFAGFGNVWRSSYTATADTAQSLCSDTSRGHRKGILHSVCVDDASAGSGTIAIYNGYNTAVNPMAVIRSTAAAGNCLIFDVDMSSGIVYTNSATNGVTMTYQCD